MLQFSNCIVAKNFNSDITISTCKLTFKQGVNLVLEDLVEFNSTFLSRANDDPQIMEAMKCLLKVIISETTMNISPLNLESSIFPVMIDKIIAPLSKQVCVETKYQNKVVAKNVNAQSLGIGSIDTWHGQPDGRARGHIFEDTDLVSHITESGTSDSESDGATSSLDAKRKIGLKDISQLVATNVVCSFTERNIHPHLSNTF